MNRYFGLGTILVLLLSACGNLKQVSKEESETVDLDTFQVHADPQPVIYKGSEKRVNDLLHMKLDISFDWDSAFAFGSAWLDLSAYHEPVSKVTLDAQGYVIHEVMAGKKDSLKKAPYEYDGELLTIDLGKTFTRDEKYQVFIKYTAKPNQLKLKGGNAIASDKGLYFIKTDTTDRSSWQIWSQGETEANSAWFPTIDAPNERMTQEIIITVDTLYETLSNGLQLFETDNRDGTKTAYWKMDLPHAPYLAMIAVGDFAIVQDKWRDLEVNYYVEKEYERYARAIFGDTPEMMEFFSQKLGVDYPWPKFSQVVVKEYVSGAMENTTAVVHGDFLQQVDRERIDSDYEDFISHELFHQWFGDLVTCESWANLPLNESFATYGEYLWIEHKYGKEAADHHLYNDLRNYLNEGVSYPKKMIRYDYRVADDMFDRHSYQKGGLILHLLRDYLGDELFFESLKQYLLAYQYTAVEIHQLRMTFEKVSGEDLTWFFDQWFFSPGHPNLSIGWEYLDSLKQVKLTIKQQQDFKKTPLFRLPVAVDLYVDGKIQREEIVLDRAVQEFNFDVASRPQLVNFDARKVLICQKNDSKTEKEWRYMYSHAPLFIDRYEALDQLVISKDSTSVLLVEKALGDPYWKMRQKAIQGIANVIELAPEQVKEKLISLSQNDPKSLVRSAAIDALAANFEDPNLVGVYVGAVNDSSYEVVSSALVALVLKDEKRGMEMARQLEDERSGKIIRTIADLYARKGAARENTFFLTARTRLSGFEQFAFVSSYTDYLERQNDSIMSIGIDVIGEIAARESTWWIRMTAVSSLQGFQAKFEKRKKTTTEKLESLKEDNPNKAVYEELLRSTDALLEKISAIIARLRESEQNERVLKTLQG